MQQQATTSIGGIPLNTSEPITDTIRQHLNAAWPNPERLRIAFLLALDIDTCHALLAGDPVDPERLDQAALDHAAARRLVRLDTTMLDHYHQQLEALRHWETAA